METLKTLLITTTLLFASYCLSKEIAISFDDAPRGATELLSGSQRTDLLIKNLKRANVKTVFFCNTKDLNVGSGKLRLNEYIQAGHLLANHSHSHLDLDKVDIETFWEDIAKADNRLQEFKGYKRWFRFPYLHEGKTLEKRDSLRQKLSRYDYQNGYVTVDNYDWYIDSLIQNKKRDGYRINMETLKQAYISILIDGINFYDELAMKSLGRSPRHMLLLHENDLAALFIHDLAQELRKMGWTIISPEEAYEDPIARIEPNTLYLGQGRVAAIAKERNKDVEIRSKWEDEPTIEKYLNELKVFSKH